MPRFLILCLLAALCASCARNFVKPDLTSATYAAAGSMESKLDFDLTQEAVALQDPFLKKLNKRNIELHAVRVRNYTADTVWIRAQDVQLLSNGRLLQPLPPRRVYKALKQPIAVHALWFLIGPFVRSDEGTNRLDYHPLGLAAVGWGIRNGIVAYKSNKEVKEMLQLSMPAGDTPILPGGSIYLLKPLPASKGSRSLELRYPDMVQNP